MLTKSGLPAPRLEIRLVRRPHLVAVQVVPQEHGVRRGSGREHVGIGIAEDVVVEPPGRLDDRLAAQIVGNAQPRDDTVERLDVELVDVLGRENRREIAGAGEILLRQVRVLILPSHSQIERQLARWLASVSLKNQA